ncbi:hypothetical protein KXD40_004687 [Peronospora effusa]|uniref:Peptidase S1 domain-containing protein n=1 Tax=Peronospora effusa TaxID=542832 RepID=A0A3M6V883_9STRA|nr:hypothetical protein DD238_008540 [Peronospora effusa]UIZ28189.1 hypothetical protein KXD40_004687 [Peronospora effusa]CAI5721403.1 unnamed protein product [Peronospora effusa]
MKVISTIISASLLIGSVTGLLGFVRVSPDGALCNRSLQQKRYMTGIRLSNGTFSMDNFNNCHDVLIKPSYVLTTNTCTLEDNAKFVVVGGLNAKGGDDGEMIEILSIYGHQGYNNETLSNNFAVLKLAREVPDNIKPVKLPTPGTDIQFGMSATGLGWGSSLDMLLKLNQKLVSNEECATVYFPLDMTSNVCAGGDAGKGMCSKDIGSPLILENFNGEDVLIGLMSAGNVTCGVKGYPAVFSRVSSVLDWINTAIEA